jgi:hypothetical protein
LRGNRGRKAGHIGFCAGSGTAVVVRDVESQHDRARLRESGLRPRDHSTAGSRGIVRSAPLVAFGPREWPCALRAGTHRVPWQRPSRARARRCLSATAAKFSRRPRARSFFGHSSRQAFLKSMRGTACDMPTSEPAGTGFMITDVPPSGQSHLRSRIPPHRPWWIKSDAPASQKASMVVPTSAPAGIPRRPLTENLRSPLRGLYADVLSEPLPPGLASLAEALERRG